MASGDEGRRTPDGLVFGPNKSGKEYISLDYHRGGANRLKGTTVSSSPKTTWRSTISRKREYSTFCLVDERSWYDGTGRGWGILDMGRTILGSAGERLCTFPKPSNSPDPWHGYPISTRDGVRDHAPPDYLIDAWKNSGVISHIVATKIKRCKL
jgi:hypothetical protein